MSKLLKKLDNAMCLGNIMLEPRLQEYVKKKDFYGKNNIEPCVPLEQEFGITKDDMQKIKCFLKGDKDLYSPEKNILNKEIPQEKQYFPSMDFAPDKRLEKIKIK